MTFAPLGDSAVVVTLGATIDESTLIRVRSLAAALERETVAGIVDVVPAYTTVTVFYETNAAAADEGGPYERVCRLIADRIAKAEHSWPDLIRQELTGAEKREVEIPVYYGGEAGPDLANVARHCGLSAADVIALHSEAEYVVCAVGFSPGFPYLSGLPRKLETPRLPTPRASVPAGSVGIGGVQTGIYPMVTPGGWQLIGRTPVSLFEPTARNPARLRAGDHVKFRAITAEAFSTWR